MFATLSLLPSASLVRRVSHRLFSPRVLVLLISGVLLAAAAWVIVAEPYAAHDDFGYNLGLVGGILMALLLPYSLRKRLRILRSTGAMRVWFLFHIWSGLFGPLLVVFHTAFHIGSFNGGAALISTLLVTASGTVGRFFYRKVHRGMTGSRESLGALQEALEHEFARLRELGAASTEVETAISAYVTYANAPPTKPWPRARHFVALGWRRLCILRRLRQSERRPLLLQAITTTLAAAQRHAQFATYERLFSLWHTIHIPFLYVLVLTAVVHVVAVHAY